MEETRSPAKTSPLFQIVYEVGLLFAALVFLLAAIHGAFTAHVCIDGIVDSTHVLAASGGAAIEPGDVFPVYRYSPEWKTEIGFVTAVKAGGSQVLFQYDPVGFHWPMGRHGVVTDVQAGIVTTNLGSEVGLAPGDALVLFDGRDRIGRIQLQEVGKTWSQGSSDTSAVRPGLHVSEFVVPTQIVVFKQPLVAGLEILLPSLMLALYAFGWVRWRRSPMEIAAGRVRRVISRCNSDGWKMGRDIALAPAFVWLIVRFSVLALPYLAGAGWRLLASALYLEPRGGLRLIDSVGGFLDHAYWVLAGVGIAVYGYVLFRKRESPIALFWKAIEFRGGPTKQMPAGRGRELTIWLLHLVIAYAFAYSLMSFLQGNMNAALNTAWPASGLQVTGSFSPAHPAQTLELFQTMGLAVAHMVTHAPTFANGDAVWITARYLLWSLTICGCLVGYGHSILGILWGKRIRNLDFTIPGWISNSVCYGPLLGVVVWQMVPPLQGRDPIFGSGPLLHLDLATEFFLDLVYMLTIWNLGTMFGVMTDKGVRCSGFYSVVRHPSYTMEALMFVALELKGLTGGSQWLGAGMFLVWYWIRSEREDVFMSRSNPEYGEYRTATRYKFIPGLY